MFKIIISLFTFFLLFNCGDKPNPVTGTAEESSPNYESLLLKNSGDSFRKVLSKKSILVFIPDLTIILSGKKTYLDYSLNPDGKISKPFPSSPCGIEVEGTWQITEDKISLDGYWKIPEKSCETDFLNDRPHSGIRKKISHQLIEFFESKKGSNELSVKIKDIGIGKATVIDP